MKSSIQIIGRSRVIPRILETLQGLPYAIAQVPAAALQDLPLLKKTKLVIVDRDRGLPAAEELRLVTRLKKSRIPFMVVTASKTLNAVLDARRLGASDIIFDDFNRRELILRVNAVLKDKARLACIGGGTGLFNLLTAIKSIPNSMITSIVTMADDGGSSGRLITSFGILPPGDVRRSLVALSNAPELMNQVMNHRFSKGAGLKDHSFGNLFLAALNSIQGSMIEAVRSLGEILNIQGIVLPITHKPSKLCAIFEDGTTVKGESNIDLGKGRQTRLRIVKAFLEPEPPASIEAISAILFADVIFIGPGDLYTSVIANLLIRDVREAIHTTSATRIYVANLMTKPGETSGFDLRDHVAEIIKYLDADALDCILASNTRIPKRAVGLYLKKKQQVVKLNRIRELKEITRAKVLIQDLGDRNELVRHNAPKLKRVVQRIVRRG
jgi:uncharacterized cofD-like protein